MSPIRVRDTGTPGKIYSNPWRGKVDHTAQIAIDITALTSDEVDATGFLKPGVPFTQAGALVGAGDVVFGCTIEPLDVLNLLPFSTVTWAAALAAAGVQQIALGTIGQINRAIIEANLERVLTADEIAGFGKAGCLVHLL